MVPSIEELDYRRTPIGELILRRRRSLSGAEVFEVKLNDRFLMSSLVNESEIALARLALADLEPKALDVVVGGLGLGYTARTALEHAGVRSVLVIEYLAEVIAWHRGELIPLGKVLTGDPRCRFENKDFFALLTAPGRNLDPQIPDRRFHAILLDIDHSPRSLLHPRHGVLYDPAGLKRLADSLYPGGVFALWSAEPPDDDFLQVLGDVYASARAHTVEFYNPLLNCDDLNTVYVARKTALDVQQSKDALKPEPPCENNGTITIDKEPGELYKILKFENLVQSGGEAKYVIAQGRVRVNGELETRKRKKIVSGDLIEFAGSAYRIAVHRKAAR